MRSFRRIALHAAVTALAGLALLAPVAAAKPSPARHVLTVTPASPTATDALTVSLPAPAVAGRYAVDLTGPQNGACRAYARRVVTVRRGAKGTTLSVNFAANDGGAFVGWCAGATSVRLLHDTPGYGFRLSAVTRFTIRKARGFTPGPFGTRVAVEVLPSSTATVAAPGRPDRVLGLSGGIDGFLPGRFVLNQDYAIAVGANADGGLPPGSGNALVVSSFVSDPLCAGPAVHTVAAVAATGSSLSFANTGAVTGTLVLMADPTTLAGCAGPDTGSTTLALSGVVGEKKLADTVLTATVANVPVGGAVLGTVTVALHLRIDILDV